jgi:hypothetical protein
MGDFEEMCLAAGESAGLTRAIKPAAEIVREMMDEAARRIRLLERLVWGSVREDLERPGSGERHAMSDAPPRQSRRDISPRRHDGVRRALEEPITTRRRQTRVGRESSQH